MTGALKVGVEKRIVKLIPRGTPLGTIVNIAYVAIDRFGRYQSAHSLAASS